MCCFNFLLKTATEVTSLRQYDQAQNRTIATDNRTMKIWKI